MKLYLAEKKVLRQKFDLYLISKSTNALIISSKRINSNFIHILFVLMIDLFTKECLIGEGGGVQLNTTRSCAEIVPLHKRMGVCGVCGECVECVECEGTTYPKVIYYDQVLTI